MKRWSLLISLATVEEIAFEQSTGCRVVNVKQRPIELMMGAHGVMEPHRNITYKFGSHVRRRAARKQNMQSAAARMKNARKLMQAQLASFTY